MGKYIDSSDPVEVSRTTAGSDLTRYSALFRLKSVPAPKNSGIGASTEADALPSHVMLSLADSTAPWAAVGTVRGRTRTVDGPVRSAMVTGPDAGKLMVPDIDETPAPLGAVSVPAEGRMSRTSLGGESLSDHAAIGWDSGAPGSNRE